MSHAPTELNWEVAMQFKQKLALACVAGFLAVSSAFAAPVSVLVPGGGSVGIQRPVNQGQPVAFEENIVFELPTTGLWAGSLFTYSPDLNGQPVLPWLHITLAEIVQGSTRISFKGISSSFNPLDFDPVEEVLTLDPQVLTGGEWRLHVQGLGFSDKHADFYKAKFELPEPSALALILGGLALAALARRRAARV